MKRAVLDIGLLIRASVLITFNWGFEGESPAHLASFDQLVR